MFAFWNTLDAHRFALRLLMLVCLGLLLANVWLGLNMRQLNHAMSRQRLYIAPSAVVKGGYITANVIPPAIVYGFTHEVFIDLNTFTGQDSFRDHIQNMAYYLTPRYRQQLIQTSHDHPSAMHRVTQIFSPYGDVGYQHTSVTQTSDGSWLVMLTLRVTHRKDGMVLLDELVRYRVRVVRVAASMKTNPWGLAIDRLESKQTLKNFLGGDTHVAQD